MRRSITVINNKLASSVITAIFLYWIVLFGAPKKILSDNGGEFNNEVMCALEKKNSFSQKVKKKLHAIHSIIYLICLELNVENIVHVS